MKTKTILWNIKMLPAHVSNVVNMRIRHYTIGNNLTVYGAIFVRGAGKVVIGDNVTITSCRETNPIGGDTKTILYAKEQSKLLIGNNVGISNSAIIALKEIVIEDNVLIGGNCKIYDNDFHSLNYDERMMKPDQGVKSAPVRIKMGAFIGAHSIILKGVTIGEKSIVGAGSVVTKSIPNGEVWAGNPARFIRKI